MLSDLEIAQAATLKPIVDIAKTLNICAEDLIPYGHAIAKLNVKCLAKLANKPSGKLILVTAMTPTPAGEGKTTTSIGLADALNLTFKQKNSDMKAIVCIREPSLGPVFGMKGGATGGGYAQVVPMENINLHFTGDFHAITSANNLLAALVDNHIHHGNQLQIDVHSITWKPCLDMNDRSLRHITLHHQYGDKTSGFDITVASEVMAIFCLAENLNDLKTRLGNIQVATSLAGKPILVCDLQAQGAMTALLKDAFQPNMVQTLEQTPALIHGGPFANIAHGCNSVIATKTALKIADYVVTEAGFGADLGAEKFFDIKCRQANLQPDLLVIVATIRALKYHGGAALSQLNTQDLTSLQKGMCNLEKHISNCVNHFGVKVLIAINHFNHDTQAEIDCLINAVETLGCKAVVCKHWAQGGAGASSLAQEAVFAIEQNTFKQNTLDFNAGLSNLPLFNSEISNLNCSKTSKSNNQFKFLYPDKLSLLLKIETIAYKIYGANKVEFSAQAALKLKLFESEYAHFPICIAKTQYSFATDSSLRGAPTGHTLQVSELRLSRGAGFIVAICGAILTMPGLPKVPASARIDVTDLGEIIGLS